MTREDSMTTAPITSIAELHEYLKAALKLEHATIPPYLTALYSIHPQTNSDASHTIRVVAVEEMLHLTLVANVLNAVGGSPDLTGTDFVGPYPGRLPSGPDDFVVGLERFCPESVDTFLNIERPAQAPTANARHQTDNADSEFPALLSVVPKAGMRYYSIGEFYAEIKRGLEYLGETIFVGDHRKQITAEYYYSGGGDVIVVTDLKSACAALELIAEQGEGYGGGIYDNEGELAHYYRFQQLKLGCYYQPGDKADHPTGPPLNIDWDAVYPIKPNARLENYPPDSELYDRVEAFNTAYAAFLDLLTRAYGGQPDLLLIAINEMFGLRDKMLQLMHNPISGTGLNAAPTFEMPPVIAKAVS